MAGNIPTRCLEENPSGYTVRLAGRFINLKVVAEEGGLDHGYVSRILSGRGTPSIAYAKRVAEALGMTLSGLLEAIEDRKADIENDPSRQ